MGYPPPPRNVNRQTPMKTVPSRLLRTRAVKIETSPFRSMWTDLKCDPVWSFHTVSLDDIYPHIIQGWEQHRMTRNNSFFFQNLFHCVKNRKDLEHFQVTSLVLKEKNSTPNCKRHLASSLWLRLCNQIGCIFTAQGIPIHPLFPVLDSANLRFCDLIGCLYTENTSGHVTSDTMMWLVVLHSTLPVPWRSGSKSILTSTN